MARITKTAPVAAKASVAMAALLASGFGGDMNFSIIERIYGASVPLYDLIAPVGVPSAIVNTLDTPFENHAQCSKELKANQAGYSVSEFEGREVFSMAVNTGQGIAYFGIMHDKDGDPIQHEEVILVKAKVNRDFAIDVEGEKVVILQKGRVVYKAVSVEYFQKMNKA